MTRAVGATFAAVIGGCAGITLWAVMAHYPVTAGIAGGLTTWFLCVLWLAGRTP